VKGLTGLLQTLLQIPTPGGDVMATRREYQAWRVWNMKRARDAARAAAAAGGTDSEPQTPAGARPISIFSRNDFSRSQSLGQSESTSFLGTSADQRVLGSIPSVTPFLESKEQKATSIGIGTLAPVRTHPSSGVEPTAADALPSPQSGRSCASETAPIPTPFKGRVDKLHIVLVSMHGLVRGSNMELGKDADTGGQVNSSCMTAATGPMCNA
jgi:hypothetical protein